MTNKIKQILASAFVSVLLICTTSIATNSYAAPAKVDKEMLSKMMTEKMWYFITGNDGYTLYIKCVSGGGYTCPIPRK